MSNSSIPFAECVLREEGEGVALLDRWHSECRRFLCAHCQGSLAYQCRASWHDQVCLFSLFSFFLQSIAKLIVVIRFRYFDAGCKAIRQEKLLVEKVGETLPPLVTVDLRSGRQCKLGENMWVLLLCLSSSSSSSLSSSPLVGTRRRETQQLATRVS